MTLTSGLNFKHRVGREWVWYLKEYTFAWFTPLEFWYGQFAYCVQGGRDIGSTSIDIWELWLYHPYQTFYNVIRKPGTLSYSILTYIDCWQRLDGICAGIHIGRFIYFMFDYRSFFEPSKDPEYYNTYKQEINTRDIPKGKISD